MKSFDVYARCKQIIYDMEVKMQIGPEPQGPRESDWNYSLRCAAFYTRARVLLKVAKEVVTSKPMLHGILLSFMLTGCALKCPEGTFPSGGHCFGKITITPSK